MHIRVREQRLRHGHEHKSSERQSELSHSVRIHSGHLGRRHGRAGSSRSNTLRSRLVHVGQRSDDHGNGDVSLLRSLDVGSRHQVCSHHAFCLSRVSSSYRTREEIQDVRKSRDPITSFRERLIQAHLATDEEFKVSLCLSLITIPSIAYCTGYRHRRQSDHRRRRKPRSKRS